MDGTATHKLQQPRMLAPDPRAAKPSRHAQIVDDGVGRPEAATLLAPESPFRNCRLAAEVERMPRWMERRLVPMLVAALGAAIIGTGLLPWNETVSATLAVTQDSPPRSVRVVDSGPLAVAMAAEGVRVAAGDVLAVVGRDRDIAELARVEDYARTVGAALRSQILPPAPVFAAVGGDVQSAHEALSAAVTALRDHELHDADSIHILDLERTVGELEQRETQTSESIKLRRSMAEAASERVQIYEQLASRGLASKDTQLARRQDLMAQRVATSDALAAREQLIRDIGSARAELAATRERVAQQRSADVAAVARALAQVAGAIESRRRESTLVAPVAGIVHLPRPHAAGEALTAGEEYAVVVPPGNRLRASGGVPSSARRDVAVGSIVRVEAPAYPASLYGFLRGRVEQVSAISLDGKYNIVVRLPDNARTTRGLIIPLRERTPVTAVITTRRVRIYEILFGSVRKGLASW